MSEVTQILDAITRGEAQASDQLLPLVYDELRHLAAAHKQGLVHRDIKSAKPGCRGKCGFPSLLDLTKCRVGAM